MITNDLNGREASRKSNIDNNSQILTGHLSNWDPNRINHYFILSVDYFSTQISVYFFIKVQRVSFLPSFNERIFCTRIGMERKTMEKNDPFPLKKILEHLE